MFTSKLIGPKITESTTVPPNPKEGDLWIDTSSGVSNILAAGNLVEKKVIAADCASVTFTGLDSSVDGDYILEGSIISTGTSELRLAINNDNGSNYKRTYHNIDNGSHGAGYTAATVPAFCNLVSGYKSVFSTTIKVIGGKLFAQTQYVKDESDMQTEIVSLVSVGTVNTVNSIVIIAVSGSYIGAGSIFRLYKTNGASVRPGPGFSAHKNGTEQTGVPNGGTETKVTFPTEEWDTHNCYDSTNSRFQPTVAGIYNIKAQVSFMNVSSAAYNLCLYKNGSIYQRGGHTYTPSSGQYPNISESFLVYLNGSTDYVELYCQNWGAGSYSISGSAQATYFQAQKVG